MPCLTLWDEISQNMTHMKGHSPKKFTPHRIFRSFYNRFYEEININQTLLWYSQASYIKKKKKKKKILDYIGELQRYV